MGKLKRLLSYVLLTALCSGFVSADSDSVKFVYYDQFEPFSWSQDGRMRGLFIDIIDEVFENRLGLTVLHEGLPWRRAQQLVRDGLADGMCTVATEERLEYATASAVPLVRINFRIFTSASHPDIDRMGQFDHLDDVKDLSLVDIAGSGWARTNLKEMEVYYAETYEQLFQILHHGRADASIRNDWQTQYLIDKLGFSDVIKALPRAMTEEPIEYTVLIAKESSFAPLMEKIEEALYEMEKDNTLQSILDRYGTLPALKE